MTGSSRASHCSFGKLFTWGDGDKGRLGHKDTEHKLVPTCVSAVVDYNIRQVACGHSLTAALTTSGKIFTMGSTIFGQLGNPQSDGRFPSIVEGRLCDVFVEELSCGAHHVAVLTARGEIYTWGKGANGRLGHGDVQDRDVPILVEALKDKQVRNIVCGSSFTAAICSHGIWGAYTSLCAGCKQLFGFTRKKHHCYNCGAPCCHACSAQKVLKCSLAPHPDKPYRVCDPCFVKMQSGADTLEILHTLQVTKTAMQQRSFNSTERSDLKFQKVQLPLLKVSDEPVRLTHENISQKRNRKAELSTMLASGTLHQWGVFDIPNKFDTFTASTRRRVRFSASVPASRIASRAVSPVSRRPTSPPLATVLKVPSLSSSLVFADELKNENAELTLEVLKLQEQVENLTQKSQLQEVELQQAAHKIKEAIKIAGEESSKCEAAKGVIKSLTAQLKDMAEKLPAQVSQPRRYIPVFTNRDAPDVVYPMSISEVPTVPEVENKYTLNTLPQQPQEINLKTRSLSVISESTFCSPIRNHISTTLSETDEDDFKSIPRRDEWTKGGNDPKYGSGQVQGQEWIEQDQPGVYLTLFGLPGSGKGLKRVRFSRKHFSERQAEQWWQENRQRVHVQYNVRTVDRTVLECTVPIKIHLQ
ncbi:hypothetical protein O6H91_12G079600 [Diphasiastrum complanatum]|nr:hypothetical protein O6H91_12G079600 [Diphasiastrum complanatum]